MYYYIYDSFLSQKKYNMAISQIENRLTDLGINGKINRLSFLKNIKQVVNEEIARGIKTVVVVGDDKTLGQVINLIGNLKIVLGFIPIDPDSRVAELLNIPIGEEACDVLSARIIRKMDLGKINQHYFITSLIVAGQITLECDGDYFITLDQKKNRVHICNLGRQFGTDAIVDDGQLDLFIENLSGWMFSKKSSVTHLVNKEIKITSARPTPILLEDEKIIIKTPASIKVMPNKIKMVTGKAL